ncbi:poly(R)-hydroxyalkanoic acid synthase subunit PhaE [Anaerolineales bacterium HSG25]|nr:poly(R)-hydroxyalkanoic acid synthase subunit PhaE [Anaerolineales bacterium HSG25]
MAMDWTEQLGTMSQAWNDAQKDMWEGWYKMVSANSLFESQNDHPDMRFVADQFKASQQNTVRLLEFVTQSWQTIFSQMEQGQDWQASMQNFMNKFQEQLQLPNEWMQMSQDAGKQWEMYIKQWEMFGSPWAKLIQHTPQSFNNSGAAGVEWSQLYWDTYDRTIGRLLEMPGVGLPREMNRKLAEGFVSWQKKEQATSEYQILMSNTLGKAYEGFMQELAQKAQQGQPLHTLREFVDLWTKTADDIFVASFETDEYIAAQWNLLNSNTAHRLKQREINEVFLSFHDMPTISEIDEANRNIYLLRKEVKSLKKGVVPVQPASTNSDASAMAEMQQTVTELRQEVEALKKELAAVKAKPKTTRRTTTRKRTTKAKTETPKTETPKPEGGES